VRKFGGFAFEQQAHVTNGFGVNLGRGEVFHTRSEAALDVELQTGARMVAGEVDFAGGNQKAAVNEIDDTIGEARRKVWTVVASSSLRSLRVT